MFVLVNVKHTIMANPLVHSKSSIKRWGGKEEDYLPIHKLLDSPKETMNNNTSRCLTHNTWFAYHIIPLIFGYSIVNSAGKSVDSVDIAMLHIAEDFRMKFVPTPQDYLKHIVVQAWMNSGVKPIDNLVAEDIATLFLDKIRNSKEIAI